MIDTQAPVAPPSTPSGWFTDPADASRLRWWNGTSWTEHVQVPPPKPTAEELAIAQAAAARAQQHALEAAYVPFSHNWNAEHDAAITETWRGGAQTLPGWFLAFSPLWIGGVSWATELAGDLLPPIARLLITIILAVALLCALANLDAKRLASRGYSRATSPLWAILLPVFFVLRTVRVGVRGIAAAIVAWLLWVPITAGIALAIVIPLVLLGGTHPVNNTPVTAPTTPTVLTPAERAAELTPTGMAARVAADYTKSGVQLTRVSCQPLPDTNDGSQTRCDLWIASGKLGTAVEQVQSDDPYLTFYQVGFTR